MAQVKRLFLDANILFTAAHNPKGLAFATIQRGAALGIEVFTSDYAYEEAKYNLTLKFPAVVATLDKLRRSLQLMTIQVDENLNPLSLPLDDLPIFQAALACKAQFLISGDKKAFGRWMNLPKKCRGLTILTLRDFVDKYLIATS